MTSAGDERREVAARLRDDNHGYGTEYDFFLHALGMSREGRGPCDWAKVHKRLADLIDPTCRAVHQGTSMDDELVCSECGASLGVEVDGEQKFVSKFCPCCGARVVES